MQHDRARQFMPFDALKGLQEALRIKEFEHERLQKGDLSEEKTEEICKAMKTLKKGDFAFATYFKDGHYFTTSGVAKLEAEYQTIIIGDVKISFDDLFDLKIIQKEVKSSKNI